MTRDTAPPLSPEEEAELRAHVAAIGLCRADENGLCATHAELAFGDGECDDSPLCAARLLATLDRERAGASPSHPHDGYAYDGCQCVCCVNVRVVGTTRSDTSALRLLLHGIQIGEQLRTALRATDTPSLDVAERQRIERDARFRDALDARRAAVLWLHGEHRNTPRSQFNAEPWYRKARRGIVGLDAALAPRESERKA